MEGKHLLGCGSGSTRVQMSDDRLIRLHNLRRVCADRRLDAAGLAKALPHARYTYWRDLLLGDKAFGEKAARKVEEGLGLPHKWLDTPHDDDDIEVIDQKNTFATQGSYTTEAKLIPSAHWREVAELFAEECARRDLKMLPGVFLVITDAAADLMGENLSQQQAATVFNKLLRVLQHGKSQQG